MNEFQKKLDQLKEILSEAAERMITVGEYARSLEVENSRLRRKLAEYEAAKDEDKSVALYKAEKKIKNYSKCPNKGDLDLTSTPISTLPNNFTVGGFLDLMESEFEHIPENLQVGGDLYIEYTPLAKHLSAGVIREMIVDKGGDVKGQIYT